MPLHPVHSHTPPSVLHTNSSCLSRPTAVAPGGGSWPLMIMPMVILSNIMSHCLSSIYINVCTGIRPTLLFQTMLRSVLRGIMTEVITVIVTLSQMSVWSLMRNTPNSPSALCWENGMYMCDISAMNGVGSAVILALMRLGGASQRTEYRWQFLCKLKVWHYDCQCHFLGNKKRNNWCAQLTAGGVRGTWEAEDWQMDKDPETFQ